MGALTSPYARFVPPRRMPEGGSSNHHASAATPDPCRDGQSVYVVRTRTGYYAPLAQREPCWEEGR